jgi:4-hydroxy-tetrahydrodipicolinate reductase
VTRIAVAGATGRMGRTLVTAAAERPALTLALAASRSPDAVDAPAGVPVVDEADLPGALARESVAVLVEFTAPAPTRHHAAACAETGTAAVVGTTGLDDDAEAALAEAAERVPVLRASNFARGLAVLRRALREAVAGLPGYDVEVTETHHAGKRDAPSGTAVDLLDDVAAVRGAAEAVHGREGTGRRADGEVGVHARRAGGVTGTHEVLIAGADESVELTHRAGSRAAFASGALDAAAWLADRAPGRYGFGDVIE